MVLSIILPRPLGSEYEWLMMSTDSFMTLSSKFTPSSSESSDLNSLPSSLVEIHRELWGNGDFLGKIFRTAKVGKADFTELQCLLDALNPGRHSDEYVSKDVLATKVVFLQSKSIPINLPPNLVDGLVP